MNLQAIEAVVRRLFNDAEFRAHAIDDPATALDEYDLATEERIALKDLCAQLAAGSLAVLAGGPIVFGSWWWW